MNAEPHHYPETHAERLEWHERGTPPGFTPYEPDAPDAYRDGLLRGFRFHRGIGPHEKAPPPVRESGAQQKDSNR